MKDHFQLLIGFGIVISRATKLKRDNKVDMMVRKNSTLIMKLRMMLKFHKYYNIQPWNLMDVTTRRKGIIL